MMKTSSLKSVMINNGLVRIGVIGTEVDSTHLYLPCQIHNWWKNDSKWMQLHSALLGCAWNNSKEG